MVKIQTDPLWLKNGPISVTDGRVVGAWIAAARARERVINQAVGVSLKVKPSVFL